MEMLLTLFGTYSPPITYPISHFLRMSPNTIPSSSLQILRVDQILTPHQPGTNTSSSRDNRNISSPCNFALYFIIFKERDGMRGRPDHQKSEYNVPLLYILISVRISIISSTSAWPRRSLGWDSLPERRGK